MRETAVPGHIIVGIALRNQTLAGRRSQIHRKPKPGPRDPECEIISIAGRFPDTGEVSTPIG